MPLGNLRIVEENYSSVVHRLKYLIEDEGMEEQPTVLVVDDELGPRESLRTILQTEYHVLIAVGGEQAVSLIERQPVDVVLLDLRMPGLSGMRVMERIKSIDPDIEVILVTGYASYDTVLEALRLRAFDYIPKPFKVPHVRERVKRAAEQRHTSALLKRSQHEAGQHPNLDTALAATLSNLQSSLSDFSHTLREVAQLLTDTSTRLLTDHGAQLDATGRELLQTMDATSQRLATLVHTMPLVAQDN